MKREQQQQGSFTGPVLLARALYECRDTRECAQELVNLRGALDAHARFLLSHATFDSAAEVAVVAEVLFWIAVQDVAALTEGEGKQLLHRARGLCTKGIALSDRAEETNHLVTARCYITRAAVYLVEGNGVAARRNLDGAIFHAPRIQDPESRALAYEKIAYVIEYDGSLLGVPFGNLRALLLRLRAGFTHWAPRRPA
ncbi:MAG: hypothetical protein B7X04_00460 [Parcubacteria group bacterium 21-54-25]|nr:MAG: hypothetical protein B7X04_00460 [Parcubacteria group bacterium 21-54-25]HQU07474.1 hypothetical protein [Candidatus Paceibacterota bacterium]